MTSSVYMETSVISYLTARPSMDMVIAARQAITGLPVLEMTDSAQALAASLLAAGHVPRASVEDALHIAPPEELGGEE